MHSEHYAELMKVTHSMPMAMFIFIVTVKYFFKAIIPKDIWMKLGFYRRKGAMDVDEDLPNFFDAVKLF